MASPEGKIELARKHLEKVLVSWNPPDWADLSVYGFYCLEAAVDAAALKLGIDIQAQHWSRVNVAKELHTMHGLPNVSNLLKDLNDVRKSEAYGDIDAPEMDAEEVSAEIERYVDAVSKII